MFASDVHFNIKFRDELSKKKHPVYTILTLVINGISSSSN